MFFLARVSAGRSSLCIGARSRGESTVRKGGAKFFVFWLPRVKAFSSKFLDKKRDTPEREGGTTKWRERERFGVFCVGVFFCGMNVSLFSFSCVVCFLMLCVL